MTDLYKRLEGYCFEEDCIVQCINDDGVTSFIKNGRSYCVAHVRFYGAGIYLDGVPCIFSSERFVVKVPIYDFEFVGDEY